MAKKQRASALSGAGTAVLAAGSGSIERNEIGQQGTPGHNVQELRCSSRTRGLHADAEAARAYERAKHRASLERYRRADRARRRRNADKIKLQNRLAVRRWRARNHEKVAAVIAVREALRAALEPRPKVRKW